MFISLYRAAAATVLLALLAGCAGSGSQTTLPAAQSAALQSITGRLAVAPVSEPARKSSGGFMHAVASKTELVYMSSWGTLGAINVFTTNGKQIGQITNGLASGSPEGMFVDAKHDLWIASGGTDRAVLMYPRGGLSPIEKLTDPLGDPIDVTVCADGTAYVANLSNAGNGNTASVQIYAKGSKTPTGTLQYAQDFRNPSVACDAAGNVFVALLIGQSVGDGRVIEFPGGKQAGAKDLGIVLQVPGGIKIDDAGNVLVSDVSAMTVTEYTEAGVPTGHSISAGTNIEGIALARDGTSVIGAAISLTQGIAWSFPAGKQETTFSCCSRIGPPLEVNYGVAVDPGIGAPPAR